MRVMLVLETRFSLCPHGCTPNGSDSFVSRCITTPLCCPLLASMRMNRLHGNGGGLTSPLTLFPQLLGKPPRISDGGGECVICLSATRRRMITRRLSDADDARRRNITPPPFVNSLVCKSHSQSQKYFLKDNHGTIESKGWGLSKQRVLGYLFIELKIDYNRFPNRLRNDGVAV